MLQTMPPQVSIRKSYEVKTSELNGHEILESGLTFQQKMNTEETKQQSASFQACNEESIQVKSSSSSKGVETVDGKNQLRNEETKQLYNEETKRLDSFSNWPAQSIIDYKKLAKAGFYYLNEGDEVMCFSCKGRLGGWQPGNQQVMKKHRELFPHCEFVNNKSNNVPLLEFSRSTENGINTSSVQNGAVENMRTEPVEGGVQTACKQVESVSDTDKQFEKLQNMEERLKTYTSWPVTFLTPTEMADAGFFYCGTEDKVQCAFCRGGIFNWQPGNDPVEQHLRQFPRCPYFSKKLYKGPNKGRDVCGIYKNQEMLHIHEQLSGGLHRSGQLEELGISLHRGPKHPEQATETARLRSFQSWPSYIPVQKEQLTKAGFFYIGISDHTKCFYCGGGLRSWEPKDDPWTEHARWFPNCAYLQLTKGQEFIDSCQQKISSASENTSSGHSSSSPLSNARSKEGVNENVEKIINSSMIQAVLESGPFPHYLVRAAVIKHERETGRGFLNIDELSDTIATIREEEMYASSSGSSENDRNSLHDELMTDDNLTTNTCSSNESSASAEREVADVTSKDLTMSESTNTEKSKGLTSGTNGKVRDICLCKICMDNEVGIVFLPCGHLLACPSCATAITDCPICRKPIKGTVRTYLP